MAALTDDATRYPLAWPTDWPRTPRAKRRAAAFRSRRQPLSVAVAVARLSDELGRLGARDELLSTNLEVRLDGLPRSTLGEPQDPGAAVYFTLKGAPRCLACDRWHRVADNIAAIAQHCDALRRIDRYGVGSLDQMFAGYAALPPKLDPWQVLGVPRTASRRQILDAYVALARQHHPDVGGDEHQMSRLNAARDEALRVLEAM
jgi:hypothetical protein